MPTKKPLSKSPLDYLEAILNLEEKNSPVRITDLAHHLKIAKPSVTQMVSSLVKLGLIRHEKYGPLELTESGKKQAAEIRHRHRVLKDFLIRVLGVTPAVAEKEACLMEHTISQDTTKKLINFLESTVDTPGSIKKPEGGG